jgi:uncharacterized OB-fold protein
VSPEPAVAKPRVPVVEGLFREESDGTGRLLGGRCPRCGGWFFPKQWSFCANPACGGGALDDVELATRGRLWSFTDNRYPPPPPYPARDPFEPYGIVAVELADEQMIVLGQLARGADVEALTLGDEMELVVESLYETDEAVRTVWKWRPIDAGGGS